MSLRRVLVIGLAVLLATTALGALAMAALSEGPGRPLVVPQSESGAIEHFAAADAQAATWRDDAVLVRVGASEGPQVDGRIDPPFLWDTVGDVDVGNGKALVWTFAYASPDIWDRSFWVSIGGDGSLLYARELRDPYTCCVEYVASVDSHDDAHAHDTEASPSPEEPVARTLRAVSADIDAPTALASVLGRSAFANFSLDHPVFQANIELVPGEGNSSMWLIGYRTATHYGAGAVVNAATGEVLHVGSWPHYVPCCRPLPPPEPPMPPTPPEPCCRPEDFHATYGGSLDGGAAFDVSFPIDSAWWLQEVSILAQLDAPAAPYERYVMTLHDNHGRTIAQAEGIDQLELVLDAVPVSGHYTAWIHRVSDVGYSWGMPLDATRVKARVDVLFAEEPPARILEYTYHGEAWSSGDHYVDLYAEGPDWQPLRADVLTLSWANEIPAESLELVLIDHWGNDVASAKGSDFAPGAQSVTLEAPEMPGHRWTAVVRGPNFAVLSTPFELHVAYVEDDAHMGVHMMEPLPSHPW